MTLNRPKMAQKGLKTAKIGQNKSIIALQIGKMVFFFFEMEIGLSEYEASHFGR